MAGIIGSALGTQTGGTPKPGQVTDQMQSDWGSYFSGAKAGDTANWGGGTLTMGDDGQAQYKAQNATNGGTVINPNSISNPAYLQILAASNPGIAKQWGEQYGYNSGVNAQDQAVFNQGIPQPTQSASQTGGASPSATTSQPGASAPAGQVGSSANTPPGIVNNAVTHSPLSQMASDFGNYWATSKPGDSQPFGAGTLTRNADGSATYTNSAGVNSVLSMGDGIQSIADANPEIANAWRDQYGYKSAGTTATPWNVSQDMTVQGQLGKVMDPNSPLMQQAKTQGLQFANDRGLLNSSMAQSAAQDSMYKAALPIAAADASMYGKSASENAANATQITGANISANTSLSNTASNNATSVANTAANNATSIANAKMQTEAAAALGLNDATYKQLTQGSASAAQLMTNYQSQLGSLLRDSSYSTPEARQAAVDQLTNATKAAINIVGATAGNVDLAQYINQLFPE